MGVRTPEFELEYKKARRSGKLPGLLGEPAIKEWKYWRYIKCKFYHNKLNTEDHYLVVLKRKEKNWWKGLTDAEVLELWRVILPEFEHERHYGRFNFYRLRSVKDIPHIHICDHLPEYV